MSHSPRSALLLAITVGLAIAACAAHPGSAPGPRGEVDALPDPRTVSSEVMINGAAYRVSAFVWRDETPGDGDRGLRASVQLVRSDGAAAPEAVRFGRIRIVYAGGSWETELREPGGAPESAGPSGVATGGPEVPIDAEVAVVVEILADGASHYGRAPNEAVRATG